MKSTQKPSEYSANQGEVILSPELRKNALLISLSGSINFAPYMIKQESIPKKTKEATKYGLKIFQRKIFYLVLFLSNKTGFFH